MTTIDIMCTEKWKKGVQELAKEVDRPVEWYLRRLLIDVNKSNDYEKLRSEIEKIKLPKEKGKESQQIKKIHVLEKEKLQRLTKFLGLTMTDFVIKLGQIEINKKIKKKIKNT